MSGSVAGRVRENPTGIVGYAVAVAGRARVRDADDRTEWWDDGPVSANEERDTDADARMGNDALEQLHETETLEDVEERADQRSGTRGTQTATETETKRD